MTDENAPNTNKRGPKPAMRDWRKRFLERYRVHGNQTLAAAEVGISRRRVQQLRRESEEFRAHYDEAAEEAADRLEAEAWRRAVEGVRRKRFNRSGQPIVDPDTGEQYTEQEHSDTLLIFLLKGLRPEKFRENLRVDGKLGLEHSGTLRHSIRELQQLPPDELVRLYRQTLGAAGADRE